MQDCCSNLECEWVGTVGFEIRFCPVCGWELWGWSERRKAIQKERLLPVKPPLGLGHTKECGN